MRVNADVACVYKSNIHNLSQKFPNISENVIKTIYIYIEVTSIYEKLLVVNQRQIYMTGDVVSKFHDMRYFLYLSKVTRYKNELRTKE